MTLLARSEFPAGELQVSRPCDCGQPECEGWLVVPVAALCNFTRVERGIVSEALMLSVLEQTEGYAAAVADRTAAIAEADAAEDKFFDRDWWHFVAGFVESHTVPQFCHDLIDFVERG